MKSMTWTGAKGNKMELRAKYEAEMTTKTINADGVTVEISNKEPHIVARLEYLKDGEIKDYSENENFWALLEPKDGYRKIWGLKVELNAENSARYEKWIAEVLEDGKTDEYKIYLAERKKAQSGKGYTPYIERD